jgi:integrase
MLQRIASFATNFVVNVVTKSPLKQPSKRRKNALNRGRVRVVKSGSVQVKIYEGTNRKPDGRRYPVFTVVYWEHDKRQRRFFSSLEDARSAAEEIGRRLNRGEQKVLELTAADASSYMYAVEQLKGLGLPLHDAVAQFVHAAKTLGGQPLSAAADYYAQRNRATVTRRTVPDVVDELLKDRKETSLRNQQTLRSHLNRFKASFATEIGRVTTAQMEAWISKIGGTKRTWNNLRCSLVTLFRFARTRGYLPKGATTEADEIERRKVPSSAANIYSPEELERVLYAADARVLPALAIGAFTGLRSASVARLRWENVKWAQRVIEVPGEIAKNGKRYLLPLLPSLAAWLAPYRARKGKVITGVRLDPSIRATFAAAGVKRLHNGLRDSFISYRVASTMNLPQVAYEAGNSVEMIRSKYLEARTKREAKAWFAVKPSAPRNVISMKRAA